MARSIENLPIYISTSDNYHHCLQPFAFLFNKFWLGDKKVTFLGYKEPQIKLPSNFDFISLGVQKDTSFYSEDMRIFFESINDFHFIYTTEDQFILDYVNFDIIEKFLEYLDEDKIGRICLTNSIFQSVQGKKHSIYDSNASDEYDIIEYSQNSEFRIAMEWSIWNKDYLCRHLPNGLTPWQFESMGSNKSKGDGYHLLGSKNKVAIHNAEAVRRRSIGKDFDFTFVNETKKLHSSVIKEMRESLL